MVGVWVSFLVKDLTNRAGLVEKRLKTEALYFFLDVNKITLPFQILFTVDKFSPFAKLLHQKNSEKSLFCLKST